MPGATLTEKGVERGVRHRAGETFERAFGDAARGADEGGPADTRETAADADGAHAERGEIVHREAERTAVEEIHRLWRDRLHHRRDLLARADARRIEAIGAGLRVGLEPRD